ncbi:MAG: hypothetical protein M3Z09_12185 [Acidobacteriota bacterium]|nr:hypothetical protein [Acidobacteriota bacterium]
MRLLAGFIVVISAFAASLTPEEIMARVAANQDRAEVLRSRYVYRQTTAIRLRDTHGNLTREEVSDFDLAPTPAGTERKLVHFTGKYRENNAMLPCETSGEPCGTGFRNEADAHMAHNLRDGLTASKDGKDGLSPKLFPLTSREQSKYVFRLKGEETIKSIAVYRIGFLPKKGDDGPDTLWAGEALIDRNDFEPVLVTTKLANGIPLVVRTALGTNFPGLGFSVSYAKLEPGVWFPVSYGTEFHFRVAFVYSRKVSVSLTNSGFKRTASDSSVSFDSVQ